MKWKWLRAAMGDAVLYLPHVCDTARLQDFRRACLQCCWPRCCPLPSSSDCLQPGPSVSVFFRIPRRWKSYWWPWRRWSRSWSPWRQSCPPLSSRWPRRKRIWPTSGPREGSTWRKFWRWSKCFYHVLHSPAVLVLGTFFFWPLATPAHLRLTCSLDLGQIRVK